MTQPTGQAKTGTGKYEALLERCRSLEAVPTAVAHPCEHSALAAAVESMPKQEGRNMIMVIAPTKKQVEAKVAETDSGATPASDEG